jgi:thioredoxin reductase (NADPH)
MEKVKCLIIGSGPAGYTAAIYTSRALLSPVLYTGLVPGGQITETHEIENFPGYPDGVNGTVMMEDMRRQAERFGTEVRQGEVTAVDLSVRPFLVTIDDGAHQIEAQSVIIATGATARYLGLPSEKKYIGMGVSACAVCDGFFYRGQDVAVVGGGDSACGEALYLASICRKVYMIVRKDHLRASKHVQKRVFDTANIEVLFEQVTDEILGNEAGVSGVRIRHSDGSERVVDVTGFFLGIGHTPRTEIFKGQIELDDEGYIVTRKASTATSVVGVFAAGDVADSTYQQAITAAGSGCRAAFDAERFLTEMKN